MKKLIAIAVVFALVAGTAFAVDLSADVTGHARLFEGETQGGQKAQTSYWMDTLRLQGSAEVMDGKFGAQLRIDPAEAKLDTTGAPKLSWSNGFQGFAWWKPIDQFKLILGQSGADDGFWGKDGCSAWGFNQKANSGIVRAIGLWEDNFSGLKYGDGDGAWYGGMGNTGVYMEIKPMDMLGINIGIPVDWKGWDKDIVKSIHFQVDLNFAFGNIALTYGKNNLYLYFSGSFGAIGLDLGLAVPKLIDNPGFTHLYFGADLKFSAGAFGIKFRTSEGIPVKSGQDFMVNVGVLPSFAFNDNMSFFFFGEMGMAMNHGLVKLGWTVNPYLRIGAEWGPSFYAGFTIMQKTKGGSLYYALPIGITVGF